MAQYRVFDEEQERVLLPRNSPFIEDPRELYIEIEEEGIKNEVYNDENNGIKIQEKEGEDWTNLDKLPTRREYHEMLLGEENR